jgi:hypothetical protein
MPPTAKRLKTIPGRKRLACMLGSFNLANVDDDFQTILDCLVPILLASPKYASAVKPLFLVNKLSKDTIENHMRANGSNFGDKICELLRLCHCCGSSLNLDRRTITTSTGNHHFWLCGLCFMQNTMLMAGRSWNGNRYSIRFPVDRAMPDYSIKFGRYMADWPWIGSGLVLWENRPILSETLASCSLRD